MGTPITVDSNFDLLAEVVLSISFTAKLLSPPPFPYFSLWKEDIESSPYEREIIFLFFFFFLVFLGLRPWHMEVPSLGVESEL